MIGYLKAINPLYMAQPAQNREGGLGVLAKDLTRGPHITSTDFSKNRKRFLF